MLRLYPDGVGNVLELYYRCKLCSDAKAYVELDSFIEHIQTEHANQTEQCSEGEENEIEIYLEDHVKQVFIFRKAVCQCHFVKSLSCFFFVRQELVTGEETDECEEMMKNVKNEVSKIIVKLILTRLTR